MLEELHNIIGIVKISQNNEMLVWIKSREFDRGSLFTAIQIARQLQMDRIAKTGLSLPVVLEYEIEQKRVAQSRIQQMSYIKKKARRMRIILKSSKGKDLV